MPARPISLRKILVATDFSDGALAALEQAVQLADATGAELTLAHVGTDPAWAVPGTSFEVHWQVPPAEIKKVERVLRRQTEERLEQTLAPRRVPRRKLRAEALFGVPFVEIIRAVQRGGYDLVLAGTRGLSGVRRFLVGSTAERLVRKCPCPVWIVKGDRPAPPRSLLVPIDFSPASAKSLFLASFLAQLWAGSLHALHVLARVDEVAPATPTPPGRQAYVSRRQVRRTAAKHLHSFLLDNAPGAAVEELIAAGTPWQRIVRTARHHAIDLIVMASVGRTGIPGLFMGSTAEKVLRRGDCSILTVKPDGFVSPVRK